MINISSILWRIGKKLYGNSKVHCCHFEIKAHNDVITGFNDSLTNIEDLTSY